MIYTNINQLTLRKKYDLIIANCGNSSAKEVTMVKYKLQYLKCKEGLIVKHGEVDVSRIRTAV